MAHGETFNQVLPQITVTGSISGSFSVDPTQTSVYATNIGVVPVDHYRTVKYNWLRATTGAPKYPLIKGIATITMTPAIVDNLGNPVTTEVHYTHTGKNPSQKGIAKSSVNGTYSDTHINIYNRSAAHIYTAPFTLVRELPGGDVCVLRIRAHKLGTETLDSGVVNTVVSPNEKSKVLILKFIIDNPFPSGND